MCKIVESAVTITESNIISQLFQLFITAAETISIL